MFNFNFKLMKKINLMSLFVILLTFGLNLNIMAQDLLITGLVDGPLSGGKPKTIELYAINDIADLSVYTVKLQSNASTDWSNPLNLEGTATAGDFIYIVKNGQTAEFNTFFNNTLVPNESSVAGFNGDDRIAIFNAANEVVDIFGELNVDGTGTAWEYKKGWAYRNANSAPSATFNIADWTVENQALAGVATNADATKPFPIGTYTATPPVSTFPEDFEDGLTLPEGWNIINGGDVNTWTISNDVAAGAHSGSNAAAIAYSQSDPHDDYLVLPAIDVEANTTDQVTFWIKHREAYVETYDVRLSTTVNDDATAFDVVLQPEQGSTSEWEQQTVNLSDYIGQTVYVAIRATAENKYFLYVDDVDVSAVPTCPSPTALTATEVAATEATLTWTAGASETAWNVIYGAEGFDPTTDGTTLNVIEATATITGLSGVTTYDVYVQADCGAGDVSELTAVKTTFTTLPTCPKPTALTATEVAATEATLTWTAGASETEWNVIYGVVGFDPATDGTTITVTEPTATITGLTETTTYDAYVQAKCSADDLSILAADVKTTFTTPCAAFVPEYTQDFTSFPPSCWSQAKGNLGEGLQGTISYWEADGFANDGTEGSARINLYANYFKEWLISPEFDLSAGGYELNYDVAVTTYSGTDSSAMGANDEVQVLYTEDGGTTWNNLKTYNASNTPSNTGDSEVIDLSSITGSAVKFAFWATDGGVDEPEDYNLYIDNFVVKTSSTCPKPTDVAASNITQATADITWTEAGNATGWNIKVSTTAIDPATVDGDVLANQATTTNSHNLTGLTPGTTYYVYVQADCDSEWTTEYTFETLPCSVIENVMASNIEQTSATIGWTESNTATEWTLKVASSSIDPATEAGDIFDATVSTNPTQDLADLTAGTTYYVYVKANCGGGWTDEYTFTTTSDCGLVTGLPFTESFEGANFPPACWTVIDVDSVGTIWQQTTQHPKTGTKAMRHRYAASSAGMQEGWIITPQIELPANSNYQLKFWEFTYWPNSYEKHSILVSTTGNEITDFAEIWTPAETPVAELIETVVNLNAYAGQNVYIAFKYEGQDADSWYIDDVTVEVTPDCPKPTDVAASNITATTADIAWAEAGNATGWNIKVSTTAIDPATADGDVLANQATTTNPHNLTGLTAGTTYYVYVQADCDSEWSTEYTFETLPCSVIENVMASNIGQTSATIGWTESNTATEWTLKVASSSIDPATGTGDIFDATVSTNPTQDLADLTVGTTYYVYVKANCGGNWTAEYTFKTLCDVITGLPFTETFEDDSQTRDCWTQEYVSGTRDWTFGAGDGSVITSAYEGELNARFTSNTYAGDKTKLITPVLDLSDGSDYQLKFHYAQVLWTVDQNTLAVFYRTDITAEWIQLSEYTEEAAEWTEVTLSLPNPSATYQIAFEGTDNYGRRVIVDNVIVEAATATTNIDLAITKPTGKVSCSLTDAETIEVEVENAGAEVVTSGTVFTFSLVSEGNTLLTEDLTIDTDLNQNDTWSGTTTGTVDLSAIGTTEFTASITQANDNVADNNSIEGSFTHFEQSLEFVDAVNDTITINSAYPYTVETNVTINPTGITETTEYLWSDASTGETLTVNADGLYTLTITTADCETEKSVYVRSFSGINELTANDVSVYPNPSSGEFNIDITLVEKQDVVISIINTNGQVVREVKFDNVDTLLERFNLNDVAEGLYNIRIATNKGVINRQVIIR